MNINVDTFGSVRRTALDSNTYFTLMWWLILGYQEVFFILRYHEEYFNKITVAVILIEAQIK